jgi:hypothetical protein
MTDRLSGHHAASSVDVIKTEDRRESRIALETETEAMV